MSDWISVKDRLPEDCNFYKIYDDGRMKFDFVLAAYEQAIDIFGRGNSQ